MSLHSNTHSMDIGQREAVETQILWI